MKLPSLANTLAELNDEDGKVALNPKISLWGKPPREVDQSFAALKKTIGMDKDVENGGVES